MPAPQAAQETLVLPEAPSDVTGGAARRELVAVGGSLTQEHRDRCGLWELVTDSTLSGPAAAAKLVARALAQSVADGDERVLLALRAAPSTWDALQRLRSHLGGEIQSLGVRRAGGSVMVDLVLARRTGPVAPSRAEAPGEAGRAAVV